VNHQPTVSIGVPVYNGERYLANALDQLLEQEYTDFEIVISDNGSTDRTPEIAQKYLGRDARVRYVRYENTVDVAASFCRAASNARGRFFMWAAADDGRPRDATTALVAAIEALPGAVMAHGPVIANLVKQDRRVAIDQAMDLSSPDAASRVRTYTRELQYNGILYCLYRLDALKPAVFRWYPGHDYLLPLQLVSRGPVAYTRTPMLVYRHVWGEVDTPMYRRERITLRDLLVYRGIRRRKCWITLLLGIRYLMTQRGVDPRVRRASTAAHVTSFVQRYPAHLASEVLFLLFTPLTWAFSPFVPAGRRLKRLWFGEAAAR
jgi:glycosyltransferase involved in cell wall biosynthesis